MRTARPLRLRRLSVKVGDVAWSHACCGFMDEGNGMFGVRREKILRAAAASLLLIALVAASALFVSQRNVRGAPPAASSQLAAASPTSSDVTQFTPAPGITVTVAATPPHSGSTSTPSSSGSANGAGSTAYTVPPRYPTPAPTSSAGSGVGSGGGSYPTPTAGGSGSGASPTPTSTSATPTVTDTPGPALVDDSEVLSQSPISMDSTSYSTTQVSFTMLNTGTTTWDSSQGYALRCVSSCWQSWYSPNSSFVVPPGMSHTFTGYMSPLKEYYYAVDDSTWRLYNWKVGLFGQKGVIPVVNHGWNLVLQENSPSCQGDGAQWALEGSSGTTSCGSNGLVLAQGGSAGVAVEITSTPASYDTGNYLVQAHVHFTGSSASTFAGIVLSMPTSNNVSRPFFMVSPAGYFCYADTTNECVPGWAATPMPASSDFDLSVYVDNNARAFGASAGGYASVGGGIYAGGFTGLIEVTASGSTDAASFSNYRLYQYK